MSYRYRDIRTGRLASRKQWQKSKVSQGGHFRRETIKKLLPEPDDLLPEGDDVIIDGTELLPTINDIDDWLAAREYTDEYDQEEYQGGIDTGE